MPVSTQDYSNEYLDSIKDRFPKYNNYTKDELISVLQKNEDRNSDPDKYVYQVETVLNEIAHEVILDADEQLTDYIFGDMSHEDSDKIQSGIHYVIKHGGRGDLVLGSRLKDPIEGIEPDTKIGPALATEHFNFIPHPFNDHMLIDENKIKMLLLLSVKSVGDSDALGRNTYKLIPQLLEIPPKNRAILRGILYKKELTADEFQENFEKIQA